MDKKKCLRITLVNSEYYPFIKLRPIFTLCQFEVESLTGVVSSVSPSGGTFNISDGTTHS